VCCARTRTRRRGATPRARDAPAARLAAANATAARDRPEAARSWAQGRGGDAGGPDGGMALLPSSENDGFGTMATDAHAALALLPSCPGATTMDITHI
jgi:hypothetical protein